MGRLFWKFFLFIWLGQMAAVFGTGALFWVERRNFENRLDNGGRPPAAGEFRVHRPSQARSDGNPHEGPPPPRHEPGGMHLPWLPMVAGCIASIFCTAGLAWYFAAPIRHLRRGFDAVAYGGLDVRVAPGMGGRRDELADLGRDFDRMTERLQSLMGAQKRLLHDVSHEMRSPLARLQAAVGLARQQPDKLSGSLQRIERESERMNQLIGELLTLSRLEAGVTGAIEAVDMGELLREIVEDARFEGSARQVGVDFQSGPMAEVQANSELLHRAIENVVRNALRYSPEGGDIRIEAGRRDGGVFHIAVSDCGPGVGADETEIIFRPFFRGATHRAGEGYGLGLAIARQVVAASQGTIRAGNRQNGGLVVAIDIPTRPSPLADQPGKAGFSV